MLRLAHGNPSPFRRLLALSISFFLGRQLGKASKLARSFPGVQFPPQPLVRAVGINRRIRTIILQRIDMRSTGWLIASIFLSVVIVYGSSSFAAEPALVPQPSHIALDDGEFHLTAQTLIVADDAARPVATQLVAALAPATGFKLATGQSSTTTNTIRLQLDPALAAQGPEAYRLTVTPTAVTISASASPGLFYGVQTLRQLLPPQIFSPQRCDGVRWDIPCLHIEDQPRFAWRGLMLDCSRHFFPKEFIERFIDLMAIHKLNTFHWHLTDDQGWRIEIKKYPKLTEIGAWRNQTQIGLADGSPPRYDDQRYGGFYTQDDIREIVRYAADRYITVVPEIEMPGHSSAAIAAYPQLSYTPQPIQVPGNWGVHTDVLSPEESTIRFYEDILTEVMDLFPSRYIHIGGDEVPVKQYESSPKAHHRLAELGLTDMKQLEPYFIGQIEKFVESKGRQMIGWDEILHPGLDPHAAVMFWHNTNGAVAAAVVGGHDVIVATTKYTYLNYYQSKDHAREPLAKNFLPLEQVYAFEAMPEGLTPQQAAHVLGPQAQLWSEYLPTPAIVEYMAYPRACALAEVGWTPAAGKHYADFLNRLAVQLQRLSYLHVNFRPLDSH